MNLLDLLGDAAAIAANPVAGLAKVALDVAPDIASLFGDDAEKAVGKLADTVRAITGTDDPAQAREMLADPTLVFQLRSQAQAFAHEERMQQMTGAITTLTATLADRQNARARDSEFIKAGRSNTRANVLLVTAGAGIVGGIGFMVFGHVDGNTAVGGCIISVVTLVWGFFCQGGSGWLMFFPVAMLVWGFFCQGGSGWLMFFPVAMLGVLSTGRRRSTVTSQAATACG